MRWASRDCGASDSIRSGDASASSPSSGTGFAGGTRRQHRHELPRVSTWTCPSSTRPAATRIAADFLWSALTSAFDTDWGRILSANKPLPPETETGIRPVVTLLSARNPWWSRILSFSSRTRSSKISAPPHTAELRAAVVARFHAPWHLAGLHPSTHPTCCRRRSRHVIVPVGGVDVANKRHPCNRWFLMGGAKT